MRSSRFILSLLAAGSVLLTPASFAQSLQDALALTYQTNPELRAKRAELRGIDELGAQARSQLRPSLNGSISGELRGGSYSPAEGGAPLPPEVAGVFSSFAGNGADSRRTAGIQLEQKLFHGGRFINGIREADARILAAQAGLVISEQQVFSAAISAYLSVLTNEESVKASTATLASLAQNRKATKARFDVGQATKTDISQADARYAGAKAQLILAESDLASARQQFARLVGQMPANLEAEIVAPNLPVGLEEALSIARDKNPQLFAARAQLKAAEYQLKKSKGLLSPSLSAKATYGFVENQFVDGDSSENSTVGLELKVPLYQGGATYSAIRKAKADVDSNRYTVQDTERRIEEQVRTAWQRVNAARAAYDANKATVSANELALEGLRLELRVGQRTVLDLLDGERELLNARLSLFKAREQFFLSQYGLLAAMGKLTTAGLQLDVQAYDPTDNQDRVKWKWIGTGRSETR